MASPTAARDSAAIPDALLGRRAQLRRLRGVATTVLPRYGITRARLAPLRHEQNTTFRVDAPGGPFVLRLNRPGVHAPATVASEMAWLVALAGDTGLGVPEPIPALDGSLTQVAGAGTTAEPRTCVLLRWQAGRFVVHGLAPVHLRRVAQLQAGLQAHGASWTPAHGFVRPRVDTLTNEAKLASVAGSAEAVVAGDHPTAQDAERSRGMVAALVSPGDAALVTRALELVLATTRELGAIPGALGLIHGDLHQENYLFAEGVARAIDFDDCGWGFHLYDLAVSLWELEDGPRYPALRDALLDEYARHRRLPPDHDVHLAALFVLRRLQILMWILESREHPAFRNDWRPWARKELLGIELAIRRAAAARG